MSKRDFRLTSAFGKRVRRRHSRIVVHFGHTPEDQALVDGIRLAAVKRRLYPGQLLKQLAASALRQWGEMPEIKHEV